MDESLEDAARRELGEETGVSDPGIYLEQLHAFGDPDRDPRTRVITVAYCALMPADCLALQAGSDAAAADWFPVCALPALAFDHADIFEYAMRWLRCKIECTTVAFQLLPERFTLTELQRAYEQILDTELDEQSFQSKMLAAGVLEETSCLPDGESRPAKLCHLRPLDRPDSDARVCVRRFSC